jgi:hypothetical protein
MRFTGLIAYELGRYTRQMSNAHQKEKGNMNDKFFYRCRYTIHFGYVSMPKHLIMYYKSKWMQSTYEC